MISALLLVVACSMAFIAGLVLYLAAYAFGTFLSRILP